MQYISMFLQGISVHAASSDWEAVCCTNASLHFITLLETRELCSRLYTRVLIRQPTNFQAHHKLCFSLIPSHQCAQALSCSLSIHFIPDGLPIYAVTHDTYYVSGQYTLHVIPM